jgi:capsular exopolysaccharide synthesis family protein
MSAITSNDSNFVAEKDLRAELISRCGLTAEAIEKIYAEMHQSNLTFPDAALRLSLVTQDEIAEALAGAHNLFLPDTSGPIENALRKISSDRRIVVRDGEPVTPGNQLILAHDPYDPRSERLRALRTELLLLNESARSANIVPILSPGSDEGRTQLAAELAISFAQLGRRTLLVDADMRKPEMHRLFGSDNQDGVARAITLGEKPVFHPVVGLPTMRLLTAGPVPPNPLELLSDGRFEKLLTDWSKNYEFIVIDTPPASQCADGLAIATLANRYLLVSRTQHTSFKSTREMLRRLETTQSKILGAVLNSF